MARCVDQRRGQGGARRGGSRAAGDHGRKLRERVRDAVRGRTLGSGHTRQAYRVAPYLLRLHGLLHRYIKKGDDLQRHLEEGSYSPTLRDDAQEARDRVFGYLREIPGKETYLALRSIAE